MAITKDLGIVTAYGYALAGGFVGTEEEFAELMNDVATTAGDAEAWARGTRGGTPVEEGAEQYENNSKYYAEQAGSEADASAASATAAAGSATTAGQRATAAGQSANNAAASATAAAGSATAASGSAGTAEQQATIARNAASAAEGSATAASGSASAASGSATAAAGSATTAGQRATAAGQSATAAATSAANAAASVASLAHPYDATATYNIGDYVIYEGALYRCTTAITTAEAWTAAHWTAATLADDVEAKANPDGYYEDMTTGNAEQLVATVAVEDQTPYNYRTSGGSASIGDRAQNKIVGGTLAWNQLASLTNKGEQDATATYSGNGGTFTATARNGRVHYRFPQINGHKYLLSAEIKTTTATTDVRLSFYGAPYVLTEATTAWQTLSLIAENTTVIGSSFLLQISDARTSDWDAIEFRNPQVFDLTQMFGSTIADYIYQLEQGEAGAGVAWFRKLFALPYYPYAEGGMESVNAGAYKTTGLNQWDEEWEVGYIQPETGANVPMNDRIRSKNFSRCLENTNYYCKIGTGNGTIIWYDADKQWIRYNTLNNNVLTSPTGAAYFKISLPSTYGTTYKNDICINLSWNGSMNGEYAPYVLHDYPLDSSLTLRGIPKLDASGNLYYDGDEYAADGSVKRRYGIVDLGIFSWVYRSEITAGFFSVTDAASGGNVTANMPYKIGSNLFVCQKYTNGGAQKGAALAGQIADKGIALLWDTDNVTFRGIYIKDTSFTDPAALKASLSGVMLVYELETPTEETAEPYQSLAVVNDWGTETFTDAAYEAGTRAMEIPVGHDTQYPENLRDKVQNSPAPSDSGDGLYNVRQVNGKLSLEADTAPGRLSALETKLPAPPAADGSYTLAVTITDGTPVYSWITA